jgi:serine/threonine-protein kinase
MSAAERTELIAAPAGGGNGSLLPPDDRRSRRGLAWAGIILGILGVFAAAALLTGYLLNGTPQVTVPNVVGDQEQVARGKIEQRGLHVAVTKIAGPRATEGQVTAQNPTPDSKADEGSTVQLTVNGGPDQTKVPDFRNKSLDGAQQLAQQAKLKLSTREVDSEKAAGTVLTQDPPPDQSVDENTTVKLTVSNGTLATVPNVVGKDQYEAVGTLRVAGFKVKVSFREDGSVPEGRVIEQNPAGNQQKPKGSLVTIVVATAPTASPSPSASVNPTPTTSPSQPFGL